MTERRLIHAFGVLTMFVATLGAGLPYALHGHILTYVVMTLILYIINGLLGTHYCGAKFTILTWPLYLIRENRKLKERNETLRR